MTGRCNAGDGFEHNRHAASGTLPRGEKRIRPVTDRIDASAESPARRRCLPRLCYPEAPLSVVRSSSLVPPGEGVATFGARARRALRSEFTGLQPRLWLASLPVSLLPPLAFPRIRTSLYRLAGVSIGPHTLLAGRLELIGPGRIEERLKIGRDCWLNAPLFADLTNSITIGDRVTIGHHAVLVTASHALGPASKRAGQVMSAPIVIGDGVWIAARVMILPGSPSVPGRSSVPGAWSPGISRSTRWPSAPQRGQYASWTPPRRLTRSIFSSGRRRPQPDRRPHTEPPLHVIHVLERVTCVREGRASRTLRARGVPDCGPVG